MGLRDIREEIMQSGVPEKLFPHIPHQAFEPLKFKHVDVLNGLNMMELQPAGGKMG